MNQHNKAMSSVYGVRRSRPEPRSGAELMRFKQKMINDFLIVNLALLAHAIPDFGVWFGIAKEDVLIRCVVL